MTRYSGAHLQPAAGLRAIACLGIVSGHSMFWLAGSQEDKMAVYRYPWMSGFMKMPQVFMDAFLVLTGFWAAHSLIDALPIVSNPGLFILRYYRSRINRIIPSTYSMLTLVYILVLPAIGSGLISFDAWRAFVEVDPFNQDNCPRLMWANFIFINNWLPYAGCVSYTWSTSVQMQFYMLVPLLFLLCRPSLPRFRSNVCAMTVFALLASLLHRLFVMNKVRLWEMIPVPFYGPYPGDSLARMHYMWSATYLSLISHATPLCLGILAYMALSSTITNTLLTRHGGKLATFTLALAGLVFMDCCTNSYGPMPSGNGYKANPMGVAIGFVLFTGLMQPMLPCMILLISCNSQSRGLNRLLSRALSASWLSKLGQLSFDVYLLHPIIIMATWSLYPPMIWFDPADARSFLIVVVAILLASFIAAWIHSQMVGVLVSVMQSVIFKLRNGKDSQAQSFHNESS